MDGTFYLGDRLLPGAAAFVAHLRRRSLPFLFLTNNSSGNRTQYADKIRRLGIPLEDDQVFTSGEATTIWLQDRTPRGRIFLAGTPALEDEFQQAGYHLVRDDPDWVVLGFDQTLTYAKLWRLCDLIRAGAPYLATHPDFNCPSEGGFMPDTGAMIAFIEASTGRRPDIIVGKPYGPIIEAVARKVGVPPEAMAMIGDRLYTDIALGEHGLLTALVLCGETKRSDLDGSPHQPDLIVEDLAELTAFLQNRR
jgi:4-nitrophenyl phosphatase